MRDIDTMTLVRPFTLNFSEPKVFALNLYIALIYGLLYIWFESFPIVFSGIYGFSLGLEGIAFIGILVGTFLVIPPFSHYLHKHLEPQFKDCGELKPEKRLPPAFIGAFCIPICLFWFGWSARPSVHWIMPIIGTGWFAIGSFLLFNSVLNDLPDAYPDIAPSVLTGNDFMRSSLGAALPLFATAVYRRLGEARCWGFWRWRLFRFRSFWYRYGERGVGMLGRIFDECSPFFLEGFWTGVVVHVKEMRAFSGSDIYRVHCTILFCILPRRPGERLDRQYWRFHIYTPFWGGGRGRGGSTIWYRMGHGLVK